MALIIWLFRKWTPNIGFLAVMKTHSMRWVSAKHVLSPFIREIVGKCPKVPMNTHTHNTTHTTPHQFHNFSSTQWTEQNLFLRGVTDTFLTLLESVRIVSAFNGPLNLFALIWLNYVFLGAPYLTSSWCQSTVALPYRYRPNVPNIFFVVSFRAGNIFHNWKPSKHPKTGFECSLHMCIDGTMLPRSLFCHPFDDP